MHSSLHISSTVIISSILCHISSESTPIISKQKATQRLPHSQRKLQHTVSRNRWTSNSGAKKGYAEVFETFSSPAAERECFEEICSFEESRELFESAGVPTDDYTSQIADAFYMPLAHPCEAFELCNEENTLHCVNKYKANLDDVKCVCDKPKNDRTYYDKYCNIKPTYCHKPIRNDQLQFAATSSYQLSSISRKTYDQSKAPEKLRECADKTLFKTKTWQFGNCLAKFNPNEAGTCYHRVFGWVGRGIWMPKTHDKLKKLIIKPKSGGKIEFTGFRLFTNSMCNVSPRVTKLWVTEAEDMFDDIELNKVYYLNETVSVSKITLKIEDYYLLPVMRFQIFGCLK